ncbi:hypothetical protein HDE69_005210 [Pedobacter cryoconitis]|uniref:HTH HARE-type domain-containing protein n=1 Tax=Pedobacter cryoconitis TaxID=188932 RepID=A0A7W9DMC2_9SPHI|nr:HTH domain-containing protein [Pedobacter cryoconitis]MBB5624113.1 hypothetical protein [Pedobacter cryoconitis]
MTFLELAEKILFEEKRAMSVNEIWQLCTEKEYNIYLNSQGKTPWDTLSAMLYVNAKDAKSIFGQTDTRPKRFYIKKMVNETDFSRDFSMSNEILEKTKTGYLEKDLHQFLAYYAHYHLRCQTKTINHSVSNKKEFGEWVHPDMVGCYYPLGEWKDEVYDLSSTIGNISIKLTSFEIKKTLTLANLRASFFQTVSNSSWANESYLVAAEISNDSDFKSELLRLSTSFGIGIINLNMDDPHSTQIIYPAKFREALDWETINKLTMNKDFKEFLTRVKIDILSKKIHKKEYDEVLELEVLKSLF